MLETSVWVRSGQQVYSWMEQTDAQFEERRNIDQASKHLDDWKDAVLWGCRTNMSAQMLSCSDGCLIVLNSRLR